MIKEFPKMEKISFKELGASLVSLGLGLGSGEFILWPLLTVTYGYGILWGALLGISIQLLLILEIQRYTSVKGEDFVSGVFRLHWFLPFLILISSVLGFGWPGFTSSGSVLFIEIFPSLAPYGGILPILFLILCASVLLFGKNVYAKLEPIQSVIVIFSFLLIAFLSVQLISISSVKSIFEGFVGVGEGYRFFPKDLNLSTFLGAIAYAGTGGILILSQSFYTIEERHGMTKYFPILTLWGKNKVTNLDVTPDDTEVSLNNFRKLRRFQTAENTILFWLLGLVTIVLLSFLARHLLEGIYVVPDSLDFLKLEALVISRDWGSIFGDMFLMIGFLALISVQIGIYDITGRISVNIFKKYPYFERFSSGTVYVYTILIQLLIGVVILLLGVGEPVWLLVIGAVINALSMGMIAVLTVILNQSVLPRGYRAKSFINILLILAALFYLVLFIVNVL